MSKAKRQRQPKKKPARVVLVGIAALLVVVCFPDWDSMAQERFTGQDTIGSLRREIAQLSARTVTSAWLHIACGAVAAYYSVGGVCEQGYSTGELSAYMRFTARDTQTVSEALSEFWTNRGCTVQTKDAGD